MTSTARGCTIRFHYPIIKLRDWKARRATLEESDNPFATVVLAHLAAQDTRRNPDRRLNAKLTLIRRLYDRGYSRERVLSLFRFIDWLLALPAELEAHVRQAVYQIEEERKMPYITSVERFGREQGRSEGKREAARRLVRARFGAVPEAL